MLQHSGGSASYSATGTMNVAFTGTAIDWIGYKGQYYGIARVRVDGGTPVLVDLYSPSWQFQTRLWGVGGLADSAHRLRIEWTGTKNSAALSNLIDADAFDVAGVLTQAPTRYEQDNTLIATTGIWSTHLRCCNTRAAAPRIAGTGR